MKELQCVPRELRTKNKSQLGIGLQDAEEKF